MVGSHLADYLYKNTDWEIYGMCRWRSPLDNISHLVEKINNEERIHLLYGDLRDYISLHDVIKKSSPDYVSLSSAKLSADYFESIRYF